MTDMQGWPSEDDGAAGTGTAQAFADIATDESGHPTETAMRQALRSVMDPEIGINIVDLGLVYEVTASDGRAHVRMTLTSMGCPLTELLHQQVNLVLCHLPKIEEADVDFVFTPPWSTEMIADEAKDELRAMGFNV